MKFKSEFILIISGVILTVSILLIGFFDSPYFYDELEEFVLNPVEFTSEVFVNDDKIDINSADAHELESLYGIGEARARAIIEYRYKNGGFLNVDELVSIKGISEEILNKNKDFITVGPYTEEKYELQSD